MLVTFVQHFLADPGERLVASPKPAEAHHIIGSAQAFVRRVPASENALHPTDAQARDAMPVVATAVTTEPVGVQPSPSVETPPSKIALAAAGPEQPLSVHTGAQALVSNDAHVPAAPDPTGRSERLAAVSAPFAPPQAEQQAPPLAAGTHISIHYRSKSAPARVDAQQLAARLASAGFTGPQLRTTAHTIRSPVVRYYFKDDASAAKLVAQKLQSKQGAWQAEDCTSYRKKPPAGTIEVWPTESR
ncbi:MAG TPA: hypothetical protein VFL55_13505 [Acetobacteraceae bacterium]|nr:hypothetical protein [Acetobacteraceae bacterium]